MSHSGPAIDVTDPYGIRDTQIRLLEILKEIDLFCRENDIQYSIDGGTLLGAVRHQGFIPWDDDADIMMDRENYKRFLELAKDKLPEELEIIGDTWVKRVTRKDNPHKAEEEDCIDLFIWDHVPEQKGKRTVKHLLLKILQGMLKKDVDYTQYSTINKIRVFVTHAMGKLFTTQRKQKWYEQVSQWGNREQTSQSNIYNSFYRLISGFTYDSRIMDEFDEIRFEDTRLMATREADGYLTAYYGDYMKLPPEEERIPVHGKKK